MERGGLKNSVSEKDLRNTTDRQLNMSSHVTLWWFEANTIFGCIGKEYQDVFTSAWHKL